METSSSNNLQLKTDDLIWTKPDNDLLGSLQSQHKKCLNGEART